MTDIMTAVGSDSKYGPFPSQPLPPPSLVTQRKRGLRPRAESEHPHKPLCAVNGAVHGNRHYVNLCHDSLPSLPSLPSHPYHSQSPSRENSVSDSEMSTSSAASVSALSESSEIRALFPTLYEHHEEHLVPAFQADLHYNQLKVKPGSKASQKSRRILYRPHHFESDSSSSLAESSDSLNTQDNKHWEVEHYNKLKLNLDNISGNKRAIFGLKILYRDPPRGYRQLPTSPSPTKSLLQQRRPRGIFHQKSLDEARPRTRYWSEGHTNKILSVAADPVRPRSLSWKCEDVTEPRQTLSNPGTPCHSTPVYRTRSLNETKSYDASMKDKELKKVKRKSSKSTDNLSHTAAHVEARRSFSATQTCDFHPSKGIFADSSATAQMCRLKKQALNSDNRRSNADREAGEVEQDRTSGSINFVMSPITLKYEGEELHYACREHNFAIKIPKGALKKKGTVEIQIGLAIHGPFKFPEKSRNVSPILWLCSIPETKFRKPIQVCLPHCVTDAHAGVLKRRKQEEGLVLHFTTASLKSGPANKSRRQQFEFHPGEGEEMFEEMTGLLSTKHPSPLCIVASSSRVQSLPRELALRASYCIVPVIPMAISGQCWSIHFCLTFNLHSCIESLMSYFNECEFQIMPHHSFKFATPTPTVPGKMWGRGEMSEIEMMGEPELEIRFPRELPESGWKLGLESERKISSSAISFSPCRRSELGHSLTSSFTSSISSTTTTHTASPPTMFTITVDGTAAERAAVTCVSFVGSLYPITVKVTLPLKEPDNHSLQ